MAWTHLTARTPADSVRRPLRRAWHDPTRRRRRAPAVLAALVLCLAGGLLAPAPAARAQAPADGTPLSVRAEAGGVRLQWQAPPPAAADAWPLPLEPLQGLLLPVATLALELPAGALLPAPQLGRDERAPLPPGLLQPVDGTPPVLLDELPSELPLQPPAPPRLPDAPLLSLRAGSLDGRTVAVLAFSPVFAPAGGNPADLAAAQWVTAFEAFIPGATLLDRSAPAPLDDPGPFAAADANDETALAQGLQASATAVLAAADEEAGRTVDGVLPAAPEQVDAATTFIVRVAAQGIQSVALATLQAQSPQVTQADLERARLTRTGAPVAVEVSAGLLRFYAPPPGDRWNNTDAYLLTVGAAAPSPRLAGRTVTPVTAPGAPSVVRDRVLWSTRTIYESYYPGADGDHWFASTLRSRPGESGQPTAGNSITAALWQTAAIRPNAGLPLANGAARHTLALSAFPADSFSSEPRYPIRVTAGATPLHTGVIDASSSAPGANPPGWRTAVTYVFTATQSAPALTLTLLPAAAPAAFKFESIAVDRPALLSFAGGAPFAGAAGQTFYRWTNPPSALLWDITQPTAPVRLAGAGAHGFTDPLPGRTYLMAGPGFAHTPAVERAALPALPTAGRALYIVPDARYVAPLQPLLNLRRAQGYTVAVADLRTIYLQYSSGQVDPRAIRRFLQQAWTNWRPRPLAVVLVGDGTWDPKNYSQKETAPALIPPYMQEGADEFLGEAPCDRCFGQINGDNPLTGDDPTGRLFDPELWVGRLPVKSVDELPPLVTKIVAYETAPDMQPAVDGLWRSRALFFTDNYLVPQPDGTFRKDGAGDFARSADALRALPPLSPTEALSPRIYYDPRPDLQTPPATGQPWRFSDPNEVAPRIVAAMNSGLALAIYNGHGSYSRIGLTEAPSPNRGQILQTGDEATLVNASQLFVFLEMTCLSAHFAVPLNTGTTIDERFLLHAGGGAVAVWGSAGISVAHGHEQLQEGFLAALARAKGRPVALGTLMDGGYDQLLLGAPDAEDALRTFLLLGDPLTSVRFRQGFGYELPIIRNGAR